MAWETKRMKDIFSFCKGLSITKEDLRETGVPVISYGQIHSKQNTGVSIADHLIRYVDYSYLETDKKSLTRVHDFIFADTSEDLEGCGNCVYVDREMTLFAGYHTLLLKGKIEQDNKFLAYVFNTDFWRTQLRKNVCGVKLFSITQKNINAVFVSYPPLSEQQRIAAYLDKQTSSIDTRIALLEQKKEKYLILRKAVINEAVSPKEGWKEVRLKEIFKTIGSGTTPDTRVDEYYDDNGYNWLQTGDLNDGYILATSKKISKIALEKYTTLKTYPKGSLVIAMYGATIGKIGHLLIETTTNQACCVLADVKNVCDRFIFYWILDHKEYIISLSTGGGQPNINQDIIKFLSVCLPSPVEQQRIASYLDQKTSQIDTIVSKITDQIENLKVLRKCIINESVREK